MDPQGCYMARVPKGTTTHKSSLKWADDLGPKQPSELVSQHRSFQMQPKPVSRTSAKGKPARPVGGPISKPNKPAYKQANKQTNKQACKKASEQRTHLHTSKNKQTHIQNRSMKPTSSNERQRQQCKNKDTTNWIIEKMT